jgi:hypothetical protein
VQAVAEHFDAPYQTASKWAARARRRGFLTPTSNGRASGEPERAKYRQIRATALRQAADFVRDAHFCDGLTVQEIGTALRHMADSVDPQDDGSTT